MHADYTQHVKAHYKINLFDDRIDYNKPNQIWYILFV